MAILLYWNEACHMNYVKVRLVHKTKRGYEKHKIAHRKIHIVPKGCDNHTIVHRKVHIVPKGSEKKKSTKISMSVIADVLSIVSSTISIVLAIIEYFTWYPLKRYRLVLCIFPSFLPQGPCRWRLHGSNPLSVLLVLEIQLSTEFIRKEFPVFFPSYLYIWDRINNYRWDVTWLGLGVVVMIRQWGCPAAAAFSAVVKYRGALLERTSEKYGMCSISSK